MSRSLDLDFLETTALRRTRRGGVAQHEGHWLYRGRPMPDGVLRELYEVLAEDGLLDVHPADEHGLRRVSLSDRGEHRSLQLIRAQPTPLPVPAPEQSTDEPGDGQRRGWCVAGCGCALEIPPSGAVHVDCPTCQPPAGQSPAGRQREGAAPLDAAGDRPDPPTADDHPAGRRPVPVRVGRRPEQIVGRERDRIATRLRQRYLTGATIRELAGESGRSFGWIRTLLLESGVQLRTRGGDHRASRRQETGR